MKLYRSHSRYFQGQINESEGFVMDNSRKFNSDRPNGLNLGNLYFYCFDVKGAEFYSLGGKLPIWEYEWEGKLLDLRLIRNRIKLKKTVSLLIEREESLRRTLVRSMGETLETHHDKELLSVPTTEEKIIFDERIRGIDLWGEKITNGQLGILMREQLKELRYDGAIIRDGSRLRVALLEPAKFIGEYRY